MIKKVTAEIEKITLNTATYKNQSFSPTLINFIFGHNGTGKSTIAQSIKDDIGLSWKEGIEHNDYVVHVYNNEYISNNVQQYHNLPGVYTFNKATIDTQNKIDELSKKRVSLEDEINISKVNLNKLTESLNDLRLEFQDQLWNKAKDERHYFKSALYGKQQKKTFHDAIVSISTGYKHNIEDIKKLFNIAFSQEGKTYSSFATITDVNILDNIDTSILSKTILSHSDTPFSEFMKLIDATVWVKQGHDKYKDTPEHKCPYCQQTLPDNFSEQLEACFDKQFQDDINQIKTLENKYNHMASQLLKNLEFIADTHPDCNLELYNDKITILKSIISENMSRISDKENHYTTSIKLKPTKDILLDLQSIIDNFNKIIVEHNSILAEKTKKQKECQKQLLEYLRFNLNDDIVNYQSKIINTSKDITELDNFIKEQTKQLTDIKKQLSLENQKVVNTSKTIDSINLLLKDTGFQGFTIQEKSTPSNVYEIIRADGTIAKNLSEGERNFIAFLYFYHQIKGSLSSEETDKNKIVVIDDPVSSLDSTALFIVGSLVRELIQICKNNAVRNNTHIKERYIKQIFILTHNAMFHKEISYNQVNHFEFVNFYLISKIDNKSNIKLCVKQNPEIPTDEMNYNPVQNGYTALWNEYMEATSCITLRNVMRRILEYYFLQLCGYDGQNLKDIILNKNREHFISILDDGRQDNTLYQIASALLSYIGHSTIGINDNAYYIEDHTNINQLKEVFYQIFKLTNQEQHYNMMMNIKMEA